MNRNMRKMYTEEEISKLGGTKLYRHIYLDVYRDFELDVITTEYNTDIGQLSLAQMLKNYVSIQLLVDGALFSGIISVVGMETTKIVIYDFNAEVYDEILLTSTREIEEHTCVPL